MNVVSFDKYAYAGNNPIKFNDPSGHAPEWFDWVEGAAYQYANNMSMGQVEQIADSLGVCMDCNVSDAYREGQQAGQNASVVVASVEEVTGSFVAAAGAAGVGPTTGGGLACAAATEGVCAIPAGGALIVEGVMVVGGAAIAGQGVGVAAFAKNNTVNGGNDRALWKVTRENSSRVVQNDKFGSFYKSKSDGRWWVKDNAGHGGVVWKVYEETSKGLEWVADADEYGDFIDNKHKGPIGDFIPWDELHGK